MSDSDRPSRRITPLGEQRYRDTVEMPPQCDIDAPGDEPEHSQTILPAAMLWPEEETI